MKIFVLLATLVQAGFAVGAPLVGHPSLYHTPLIHMESMTCDPSALRPIYDDHNQVLAKLCPKDYQQCQIEGACFLAQQSGQRLGLNFYKYDPASERNYFTVINPADCSYNFGFGKISATKAGLTCLNPYYSVAADPTAHDLGEVMFIPALKGLPLPGGDVHDGYVIVADYSKQLIGAPNRFVFFTGFLTKKSTENPLVVLKFYDIDTPFNYEVVTGAKAAEIRQKRNFKILKEFNRTFKAKEEAGLE